jgi:hypothetical protein
VRAIEPVSWRHRRRQLAPETMELDGPPSPARIMVSALLTQVLESKVLCKLTRVRS